MHGLSYCSEYNFVFTMCVSTQFVWYSNDLYLLVLLIQSSNRSVRNCSAFVCFQTQFCKMVFKIGAILRQLRFSQYAWQDDFTPNRVEIRVTSIIDLQFNKCYRLNGINCTLEIIYFKRKETFLVLNCGRSKSYGSFRKNVNFSSRQAIYAHIWRVFLLLL